MKYLHNIDKSGFRKGQYVGYSDIGVFRIRRRDDGWLAVPQAAAEPVIRAGTLEEVSRQLEQLKRE